MDNINKKSKQIVANIVKILHLLLVIIILIIPFLNYNSYLFFYIIFIPFILLHWLTNNDTCVLTLIEKKLRNVKTKEEEEQCFTQQLISPVFTFANDYKQFSLLSYSIVIILWSVAFSKLIYKYDSGEIRNMFDLFIK